MTDPQDQAEQLDDDKIGGQFPPDTQLGAAAYGAAGTDPPVGESVARRAAREEPEEKPEPTGVPADDDPVDDVAQERSAPIAAEEAAVHPIDPGPAVESEIDDPELAAAHEIDPPVER